MSGHEYGLADMFDLGTGTWLVFLAFGGIALKAIRNHASLVSLLVALPVVVFMSIVVNYAFRLMMFFSPEKMAEWLAFTIMAGTFGTLIGVAIVIAIDGAVDRVPPTPDPSKLTPGL